jgi:hypothetical protein
MIDKELVKEKYLKWVDQVSEDLEDKTHFTVDEIVSKVTDLVLEQVNDNVSYNDSCDCEDKNYSVPEINKQMCFQCKKKIDCI